MTSSVVTDDLELVGREVESKLLDSLLGRVADGGGALIFRGEPGIGKSALLDRARERARGWGARVLTTTGVESEAELSFAGLHQLLHPIIGLIARLSDPQRRARLSDAAVGVAQRMKARLRIRASQPWTSSG